MQIEIHTAEPLVSGPSRLQFQTAIAKLKLYEWANSDQNPTGLIQAGGEIVVFAICQ
jgi:hypothetical protein